MSNIIANHTSTRMEYSTTACRTAPSESPNVGARLGETPSPTSFLSASCPLLQQALAKHKHPTHPTTTVCRTQPLSAPTWMHAHLFYCTLLHTIMSDLASTSFTIKVNGNPITNPGEIDDRLQAQTGSDAAVFTLKHDRLTSGGNFLGRHLVEDRSLLPKKVYWVKAEDEDRIQHVQVSQHDNVYHLNFGGKARD